jgi:hypothetical protein
MQKIEWIENLKIGDQVIMVTGKFYRIGKVTGVSKKSVYIDKERFSKFEDYGIEPYNKENLKKIQEEREEKLKYIASQGEDPKKYERLSEAGIHYAYEKFKYAEWERNFDIKNYMK